MKKLLLNIFKIFSNPIDIILSIVIVPGAYLLLLFRSIRGSRLPRTNRRLKKIGVYPIRDHYYEPLFNHKRLLKPLNEDRELPGINLDIEKQINFLSKLQCSKELKLIDLERPAYSSLDFSLRNPFFSHGDAEFLYQVIRFLKPTKLIEIGCGHSTKIARLALKQNELESSKRTKHICIEPFEQSWLKDLDGINLIRERIEKLEFDWKNELTEGDMLFIDSSHIIRPQGDVVSVYLQIIPKLSQGVYIHVHDIFTPKDYLKNWIIDEVCFWNEQYLLEALLSDTKKYEIVAALNYLKHNHYNALKSVCPYLSTEHEPGSFYFKVLHN
jgi:hypothetical protein